MGLARKQLANMRTDRHITPEGQRGFTLLELIVVMAVLVTLIGLSFAAFSLIGSNDMVEAKTEIRLMMQAISKYAEENGGRYPPNVLPDDVDIVPENEDDDTVGDDGETLENLKRDRASIAALHYFLTRQFFTNQPTDEDSEQLAEFDPQIIGRYRLTGKGPYLNRSIFDEYQYGSATAGTDEDINVTLPDPGYTGQTTWLLDPWGTPYRYILKDKGRRYIIESAGPDGKFGVTLEQIEEYEKINTEEEEEEEEDPDDEDDDFEYKGEFEYSDLTEEQLEQMKDNIRSYDLE